jgi:hypothetical protein
LLRLLKHAPAHSEDDRASTYSENSEDHTEAQADDLANPNSLHKDLPAPRPVEMTTTAVSDVVDLPWLSNSLEKGGHELTGGADAA